MDVEAAWVTYRETRSLEDRNVLVEHYLPLVEQVASRYSYSLVSHVDVGDLIGYGMFGLIDAVTKFDPETSRNFQGFAWKRIKGAIVDELRQFDTVRRRGREAATRIDQAKTVLRERLGRNPTVAEIAVELKMSVDRLSEQVSLTSAMERPLSLSHGDPGDADLTEQFPDLGDEIDEMYEVNELRAVVASAWNRLPVRERTVLVLRYVEGLDLKGVGAALSIGTSRASQLHTEAIRLLRSKIAVL